MTGPCPPIPDHDWPEELADLQGGFATGLNVYRTMAHHPALLRAWADLRQHVVKENALALDLLEIVILRVGLRMGAAYEWAHHVSRSRALGMSDARILAVREMPSGLDGLLVRGVDALIDDKRLAPELEAEISAAFGGAAVFDLMATVAFYSGLGYILNTYGTPVDEAVARELAQRPL